jgi:hypothetical protein
MGQNISFADDAGAALSATSVTKRVFAVFLEMPAGLLKQAAAPSDYTITSQMVLSS